MCDYACRDLLDLLELTVVLDGTEMTEPTVTQDELVVQDNQEIQ